MGQKKLLKMLAEFFDMDERTRVKKKEEMADLLSRLKSKEQELKKELEAEHDKHHKHKLTQKINVVHSQRKKGIKKLKEMKND